MDADFGAAQAEEIFFSFVGAGTVKAVRLLMVDALHLETFMEVIPSMGFVGTNGRGLGDVAADECSGAALAAEHCRDRIAAALAK